MLWLIQGRDARALSICFEFGTRILRVIHGGTPVLLSICFEFGTRILLIHGRDARATQHLSRIRDAHLARDSLAERPRHPAFAKLFETTHSILT